MTEPSPNAEFIACWSDVILPKFRRFRDVFVKGAAVHSHGAIESFVREGARVLDVGCGFGETSIDIARRVGAKGFVVGADCVPAFLETAREDAEKAGVKNVRFDLCDAQITPFPREYDVVFSRFGTMFFQSPVAAFRNFHKGLVSGGQLVFIVWRALEHNPAFLLPKQIAQQILPPPPDKGQTCGPGPFSMADQETVTAMLEAGGFRNPRFLRTDHLMYMGKTLDEAMTLQLQLGPAGELMREAAEEGERLRPQVEAELTRRMQEFLREDGVYMQSSSWAISVKRED